MCSTFVCPTATRATSKNKFTLLYDDFSTVPAFYYDKGVAELVIYFQVTDVLSQLNLSNLPISHRCFAGDSTGMHRNDERKGEVCKGCEATGYCFVH